MKHAVALIFMSVCAGIYASELTCDTLFVQWQQLGCENEQCGNTVECQNVHDNYQANCTCRTQQQLLAVATENFRSLNTLTEASFTSTVFLDTPVAALSAMLEQVPYDVSADTATIMQTKQCMNGITDAGVAQVFYYAFVPGVQEQMIISQIPDPTQVPIVIETFVAADESEQNTRRRLNTATCTTWPPEDSMCATFGTGLTRGQKCCTMYRCRGTEKEPGLYCGDQTSYFDENSNEFAAFGAFVQALVKCGNGNLDPGEECDDGDGHDGNVCTNDCKIATCGDGIIQWQNNNGDAEECDDGNTNNNDGCRNDCTLPYCGDGIVDDGEQCDDGNANNNDDCLSTCELQVVDSVVIETGAGSYQLLTPGSVFDICQFSMAAKEFEDSIIDSGECHASPSFRDYDCKSWTGAQATYTCGLKKYVHYPCIDDDDEAQALANSMGTSISGCCQAHSQCQLPALATLCPVTCGTCPQTALSDLVDKAVFNADNDIPSLSDVRKQIAEKMGVFWTGFELLKNELTKQNIDNELWDKAAAIYTGCQGLTTLPYAVGGTDTALYSFAQKFSKTNDGTNTRTGDVANINTEILSTFASGPTTNNADYIMRMSKLIFAQATLRYAYKISNQLTKIVEEWGQYFNCCDGWSEDTGCTCSLQNMVMSQNEPNWWRQMNWEYAHIAAEGFSVSSVLADDSIFAALIDLNTKFQNITLSNDLADDAFTLWYGGDTEAEEMRAHYEQFIALENANRTSIFSTIYCDTKSKIENAISAWNDEDKAYLGEYVNNSGDSYAC